MGKLEEEVVKIFDVARDEIRANMATPYATKNGTRWINATGKSSRAFQIDVEDGHIKLVYRGADVAPLESIQYGQKNTPTVEQIERWRQAKIESGALIPQSAEAISRKIARDGTERHNEPQEWIITPVVDETVEELKKVLPSLFIEKIKEELL